MFCDESEKYCEFKYSKKFSRLSSFDDEINIDLVKKLLQGIRDDVKNQAMLQKSFDMDGYIKYYINDFSFDKPKMIKYDNLDEMIERLNKTYFRFDYDKKSRPTKEDDKKLIEQLIVTKGKTIKKISLCMESVMKKYPLML